MSDVILRVENLKVKLDNQEILKDISFDVKKGEILTIIGPNGAGKTVLFKALLGLIPYEGKITWINEVKIGYVPQKFSISHDLPLNVKEFLTLKDSKEDLYRVLKSVGFRVEDEHHLIHHLLKFPIGSLSGGELQRILIAFAILGKPNVLLFDEPTSGIDIGGEETIYNLLQKLRDELNLTILLISHDLHIVYHYATNILCLNKEKICFGPAHQVFDSESLKKLYGFETGVYQHLEHRY